MIKYLFRLVKGSVDLLIKTANTREVLVGSYVGHCIVAFFWFAAIIMIASIVMNFFFCDLAFEQYFTYLLDRQDLGGENNDEDIS